jgi:hypothetical protein
MELDLFTMEKSIKGAQFTGMLTIQALQSHVSRNAFMLNFVDDIIILIDQTNKPLPNQMAVNKYPNTAPKKKKKSAKCKLLCDH